ncbi:MAG: gamma-glutamyl-gamma-aminobutyrate hydrolase family protein [Verrucomicrobiae bacterium]|nr:gamma-glutamyl-gamma-aminobutyrate hydrolase family protein [Verrucomicrobiae bacterium]
MPTIATWIRPVDREFFRDIFSPYPDVVLLDQKRALENGRSVDLTRADGLLLTGGPDVDGSFLHQPIPDPTLIKGAQPDRDQWEIASLRRIIHDHRPFLCICKGVQILNVALGGTLILDIPHHDTKETKLANIQKLRHSSRAPFRFPAVNSSHHQALDRVVGSLVVDSWSADDGIVEAVHLKDSPFGIGTQYHPERDPYYQPLFDGFVEALRKQSASSGKAPR